MTDAFTDLNVVFRCPPELEGVLPRPSLALLGLPDWFKAMPASAFSSVMQTEQLTVKKCPPFIDAMTHGFLIPLVTDLKIEDGAFSWDFEMPGGAITSYSRSTVLRSPARRCSRTTPLSSNSIISGRSNRRPAIRCSSPIRSIATICRS
jgi:hypothetical protein